MKLLYDNIGFVYVSERIEASILMCTMRRHRFHVVPLGRWAALSPSRPLSFPTLYGLLQGSHSIITRCGCISSIVRRRDRRRCHHFRYFR